MNCLWPGFLGVVVTKFSYPFTTTAPETIIYLWNVFNKRDNICAPFHLAWRTQRCFTLHPKPSVVSAGQPVPWSRCSEDQESLGKANVLWVWSVFDRLSYLEVPKEVEHLFSLGLVWMRSQSEGLEKFGCGAGWVCEWCCDCGFCQPWWWWVQVTQVWWVRPVPTCPLRIQD